MSIKFHWMKCSWLLRKLLHYMLSMWWVMWLLLLLVSYYIYLIGYMIIIYNLLYFICKYIAFSNSKTSKVATIMHWKPERNQNIVLKSRGPAKRNCVFLFKCKIIFWWVTLYFYISNNSDISLLELLIRGICHHTYV